MASKSKRRRRVLGASCILAALIVGASSFAWFTSKDEVSNRLTATADYGVSVVEDFTPPKDMTPGQEVTKKVSAVNTGSVDALVRTQLESMLKITLPSTIDLTSTVTADTSNSPYTDYTFDVKYTPDSGSTSAALSFTSGGNAENAIKLKAPQAQQADGTLTPDEVTTLQAGGELVVEANKSVRVADQAVRSGAYKTANGEYDDTGKYTPSTAGLYLFRRTVREGDNNTTTKYSGYYFDGTNYYALATEDGNKTVYVAATINETAQGTGSVVSSISGLKMRTAVTEDNAATQSKISYAIGYIGVSTDKTKTPDDIGTTVSTETVGFVADGTTQKYIKVTYDNGTNDVIFYIELAENWSNYWQYVDDEVDPTNGESTPTTLGKAYGHFYYKDDLGAGQTSKKLIESVTLSNEVTQDCYIDLVYDLNVVLDSVQVTYDANGVELVPGASAVNTQTAVAAFANAKATATNQTDGKVANGDIASITWAAP